MKIYLVNEERQRNKFKHSVFKLIPENFLSPGFDWYLN